MTMAQLTEVPVPLPVQESKPEVTLPIRTSRIDVLNADVFHKKMDENENTMWRKLTNEERVEKVKEYFQREFNHSGTRDTIASSTQELLLKKVLDGELRLKKEIDYDRINARIIKINVLVPQQHTNHYVYQPSSISQKEKSRRSARNMLMRKKN